MAAIDEWKEKLICPKCRKTGWADLSQDDGAEFPIVDSLPHGFKAITSEFGPTFQCDTCNVDVVP